MKNSYYPILLLLVIVMMVIPVLTTAQTISHPLLSHSISEGAQEQKVDKGIALEKALSILEEKFEVHFLYRSNLLEQKMIPDVDVVYQDRELSAILQSLLNGSDLTYRQISHRTIGIAPENSVEEVLDIYQDTVRGTVVDEQTGSTLPGVNVVVKGTTTGTATDMNGEFELSVSSLNETLVVSYIGYETKEIAINGRTIIPIAITSVTMVGDELVVTALGIQRDRRELGYSVQSLTVENFSSAPTENILNSLSGKLAGVQVTSGGSSVGSSSRIIIRGNASLRGNQPLYVVDGVPIDNRTSQPAVTGGIDWGDVAADLDYNNIESITVLKGASAAALYGSRATNGVILVETKNAPARGRNMELNVRSSVVLDIPSYFHDYQNEYGGGNRGSEFDYQQWLAKNPGQNLTYNEYAKRFSYNYVNGSGGGVNDGNPRSWGPRLDAGLLLDQWSTGPNSPWISRPNNISDYFNTGQTTENSVSIAMRDRYYSGRVSVTNRDIDGIIDNTDQTQNTFSGNFRFTPTDRITASTNFTLLKRKSDNVPLVAYSSGMVNLNWSGRDIDIASMRNAFKENANEGNIFPRDNLFYVLRNTNGFTRNRIYGDITVNYEITDWLSATARTGIDSYSETRKSIQQSGLRAFVNQGIGGRFNQSNINFEEINADIMLEAQQQLSEDIRIDALVGANYRHDSYSQAGMSANDLTVPDLYTISNAKGNPGVSMFNSEKKTNSIYASANASYRNFLFLGVTGRNDWSSTLPSNSRSYFYPSVNLGFNVFEAFGIEPGVLSHLQLRANWAKVGGDTSPYQLQRTYSASSFANMSFFEAGTTLPPVNLMPEETLSYEIGTDLRFFDNRLGIDATYYTQVTQNQILNVPISWSTGFSSMLLNAAEIENSGVELILNGNVIQSSAPGGLNWNMTVNWAKNKNMVNELYGNIEAIVISPGQGGNTTRAIAGEEWGVIWGLGYVRNDNGDIIIGPNGIPLTSSEPDKRGTVNPDWTGGIQNSFRYKGFDMSFLIDMKKGGDFWSVAANQSWPTGNYGITTRNNVREEGIIVEGVKQDGTPNDVRVSAQDYFNGAWVWANNEYPIIDGTFIKLREVVLGYTFNVSQISWLSNVNVSAFGRNLAILHRHKSAKDYGIDPEVGIGGGDIGVGYENHQFPTTRTVGFRMSFTY